MRNQAKRRNCFDDSGFCDLAVILVPTRLSCSELSGRHLPTFPILPLILRGDPVFVFWYLYFHHGVGYVNFFTYLLLLVLFV